MTGIAAGLRAACCSAWSHPAARLLIGPRLHPGGTKATLRTIDALGLSSGSVVVDLGCGFGLGLETLTRCGYVGFGIELGSDAAVAARHHGPVAVADAGRPPVRTGALDGVIAECVLSLVPDKLALLSEAHRMLRAGGRIAFSDVVVGGRLPDELSGAAGWIACLAGALPQLGYEDLLGNAGFVEVTVESRNADLAELLEQMKRRLSLVELGDSAGIVDVAAVGATPSMFARARHLIDTAREAVGRGALGYSILHATRP